MLKERFVLYKEPFDCAVILLRDGFILIFNNRGGNGRANEQLVPHLISWNRGNSKDRRHVELGQIWGCLWSLKVDLGVFQDFFAAAEEIETYSERRRKR